MKIHKVSLKNIKNFKGRCDFDFNGSSSINTVSGINGSGKSTLFKSILIAQRAFFSHIHRGRMDFEDRISAELLHHFTSLDSEISITFLMDGPTETFASFSISCISRDANHINWKFNCDDEDFREINKYWNLENPRRLIIYIDSNRYINESDFSHEGISLNTSTSGNDLALDYIFYPDSIFSSIYESIIKDYLRERVIPNKPRKDLPHFCAKILIKKLLRYIEVSNFTGLSRKNQFVLQIKPKRTSGGNYDVRNMSSGEKTIFYILHFICYVKNIGMLIIDEPENNLHENMLSEFVSLLNEICENESFGDLIKKTSTGNRDPLGEVIKRQIKTFYKDHELSQVYLLTHSKNLIYNNFSKGANYYVDKGLKPLAYDDAEIVLRSIGLSKIYSKVLFVEGIKDNVLLEGILNPHNIKVRSLGSCHAVIETFKKYLNLKEHIHDVQFCFMIDKDTRTNSDIEAIRSQHQEDFDKCFIVLERHEIENYFLDSKIYLELFDRHRTLFPELTTPNETTIKANIKTFADKHKKLVLKKQLQNLNQKSFGPLKVAVSDGQLPLGSKAEYERYIDDAFKPDSLQDTISKLKINYVEANAALSDWETDWISLCDGKAVFNEYIGTLSMQIQINRKRLISEIVAIALGSNSIEAHGIAKTILRKFE